MVVGDKITDRCWEKFHVRKTRLSVPARVVIISVSLESPVLLDNTKRQAQLY